MSPLFNPRYIAPNWTCLYGEMVSWRDQGMLRLLNVHCQLDVALESV